MKATLRNLLLGAAVAALVACVPMAPPGAVFIRAQFGPPAPQYEVVGVAPGPDFVWIRGYYQWGGDNYYWVPGRWEQRPYPEATYVPGRWYRANQGWYWTEGRWRGHGRGRGHDREDDDRDH